jgi:very-short-patch-repair endonuclease
MKFKERWKTCLEARKAFKKAVKAKRRLRLRKDATVKQKNTRNSDRAKEMRANPTKCEAILYDALTEAGITFEAQVQVGPYIADALLGRVHVVEVDGSVHNYRKDYDFARDQYMWNHGYRVVRFTNYEVKKDVKAVIGKIHRFMAEVAG